MVQKVTVNGANLMDTYVQVEREIWQEEQRAPASALTHTVSKLEKIILELEKLTVDISRSQNYSFNQMPTPNVDAE